MLWHCAGQRPPHRCRAQLYTSARGPWGGGGRGDRTTVGAVPPPTANGVALVRGPRGGVRMTEGRGVRSVPGTAWLCAARGPVPWQSTAPRGALGCPECPQPPPPPPEGGRSGGTPDATKGLCRRLSQPVPEGLAGPLCKERSVLRRVRPPCVCQPDTDFRFRGGGGVGERGSIGSTIN